MSAAGTRAVPAALATASGREAARWVAEHCRAMPWLTAATVGTTVAGAALQVLPVLLLGQVVDGVTGGEPRSLLVRIGVLMAAAALFGAAVTPAATKRIGRRGAGNRAWLRERPRRAGRAMP
ncbi:ABC transporter ATP-binding protein, partial [Streptomyces sp. NPDC059783]